MAEEYTLRNYGNIPILTLEEPDIYGKYYWLGMLEEDNLFIIHPKKSSTLFMYNLFKNTGIRRFYEITENNLFRLKRFMENDQKILRDIDIEKIKRIAELEKRLIDEERIILNEIGVSA